MDHALEPTTAVFQDDQSRNLSATDLLPSMYLIFGILGLFGNGLVLFVFLRVRSLRTITNLFIGNQSLIDLVSSIFLLATKYRDTNTDIRSSTDVKTGWFLCRFWTSDYIFWALLLASTANLVLLTLERYVALVYPHTYRNRVDWGSAKLAAILPWIFGFIFQSYWPAVHRVNGNACYPDWRSPTVQAVTGLAIFFMKHLCPISVIIVVYVVIAQKLKNTKVGVGIALEDFSKQNNGHKRDQQMLSGKSAIEQNTSSHQRRQPEQQQRCPGQPSSLSQEVHQQQRRDEQSHHHQGKVSQLREEQRVTGQSGRMGPNSDMQHKVRRNVIKTLALVSVVFIICWTPNQTMFLFYNLGFYDLDFNSFEYVLGVLLAFCNIWINPFIYTFKYRKFQRGLRKVFCNHKFTVTSSSNST